MAEQKKGGVLLGCIGLTVLSCAGLFGWAYVESQSPEYKAEQAQKEAKRAARKEGEAASIPVIPERMRAIAAKIPADPSTLPATCPASKTPKKALHTTDAAALAGWGADHWTRPGGDWQSWDFRRSFDFYPFLKTLDPAKMDAGADLVAGEYGYQIEQAGLLGVWVPKAEAWPKVSGDSFEPGYFDGWLVVFDYATAEPACAMAVKAQNHETVKATQIKVKGIPLSGGMKGAVEGDLIEGFQQSASAAATAAGLQLDF